MSTAVWAIIFVFAFIIGGMITLLRTANKYKFPKNYDRSKVGFDDEDDWPARSNSKNNSEVTPNSASLDDTPPAETEQPKS
ncbi:hypothetical protein FLL45_11465 [Aliikangiella marina]|uniref:DUF2897 family protein n=1 Tax=Aliikangiella marina TaxID=1712262 RepID=A0A545TEC6_9GAMM|nr:DUF2897 family protein [Aliikangiella marina]TQV75526.1 hypothetical protein FLL45_11465 [Aliikangiella marina]